MSIASNDDQVSERSTTCYSTDCIKLLRSKCQSKASLKVTRDIRTSGSYSTTTFIGLVEKYAKFEVKVLKFSILYFDLNNKNK